MHKKKTSPKFIAAVAAAIIAVIAAVILIICLASDDDGTTPAVSSAETTSVATTADTTAAETTGATEATTGTTAATEPADTEATETETSATQTQPAETTTGTSYTPPTDRNTDFSDCLFIGDSRTQGLMMYSGVKGATAYASRGLMVDTFFTVPAVDVNGTKVSASEAVTASKDFKYVFIMFGINELGWPYESVFADKYGKVVDHVRAAMPNAKIIVQSIIPVTAAKSSSDDVYNNERIALFNSVIKNMCAEKGVTYFDLGPILGDSSGALPDGAAFDGVHLQKAYCQKWLDSLRSAM